MKALIAMSGGVDSSVAAYLVKKMGYDCIGCTMKLYENPETCSANSKTCCSLDDVEDARSVAARLEMPYYVLNFMDDFYDKVIKPFIQNYEEGRTPNPCIECNRCMKFDKLHVRAMQLGCDYVVTGHYARIEKVGEKFVLKKALDPSKDQSYVLYAMTQEQLAHTLFPLGGMNKTETRKVADESGFVNADKPDSQDICFVPDGDYASVIEKYTGKKCLPGDFISVKGKKLGQHKGIIHYTIGQRHGLGIPASEPLYVCRIDPAQNAVILGYKDDLLADYAYASKFNWISGEAPKEAFHCAVKIRYRQVEQPAVVIPLGAERVKIVFDEPQRAVTPGQAAVLYDGDVVLGGGTLD